MLNKKAPPNSPTIERSDEGIHKHGPSTDRSALPSLKRFTNADKLITIKIGGIYLDLHGTYIDQSFDHAFGTKHQGYYECTEVTHCGESMPLDIFDMKILESFDDRLNE